MGGAVRVTGSGDGCPDWPTCFGNWIPPFEYHALMEYTHRTIGVLVGLTIIAAVLRVWARHRGETSVVTSATAGLVAVSITGGIGGAVVLSELNPALRTLHLMLAESVLTSDCPRARGDGLRAFQWRRRWIAALAGSAGTCGICYDADRVALRVLRGLAEAQARCVLRGRCAAVR